MRKRGCRCRVGKVVGRNVNSLNRGNRTLFGRRNTLLQVAHLGSQRWLIPYSRWHTTKQRRYLGACLREAEDVVDKQQNVLTLVTEVLSRGKTSQANTQTCSWRLIHLTVNQAGFIDNARFFHFEVQVGTFTRTLTYAGEHRGTTMLLCQVVNKFLNKNGFTNTSAAKQTRFTTAYIGLKQVNCFNTCFKNFGLGGKFVKRRRRVVNRIILYVVRDFFTINRLTHNVPHATQG